jgi:hypothetical protein
MASARIHAIGTIAPGIAFGHAAHAMPRLDLAGVTAPTPDGGTWFDAKQMLPGIKHRYLNDTVRYSLAAALRCRQSAGDDIAPERLGVFLGTAVADFAVRDQFDHVVIANGADALNTVSAPNISANIAAAHVAIACHARAFSTTLTSPFLAGFESLYLGVQALRLGQCDQVLAIAAEESLPAGADCQVLPGALALQLATDAHPETAGRRLRTLCWARHCEPSNATTRLIDAVAALPPALRQDARLVVLRDDSPIASELALHCADAWHAREDVVGNLKGTTEEIVLRGPGALEPMLRAAHWLTVDHPVVLLAIHERRFLAFVIHH